MNSEILNFLLGQGPLDGVWFGEKHPNKQGSFWWRSHLRRMQEWRPIDQFEDAGRVFIFVDANKNQWMDANPDQYIVNGCGFPATHFRERPEPPMEAA